MAIGEAITKVQTVFKGVFNLPETFATDGSQFDALVEEGRSYDAGSLSFTVIGTPGHTPACVTYQIGDAIFTGDALFMPDSGTGRCDFPAGSAEDLYTSIRKLYELPDDTRVFVGHDYQPGGRDVAWETTIGASKAANIQLKGETSRKDFVGFRNQRDAGLAAPRLLFQSVQVNVDAGRLPGAEAQRAGLPEDAVERLQGLMLTKALLRDPVLSQLPPEGRAAHAEGLSGLPLSPT